MSDHIPVIPTPAEMLRRHTHTSPEELREERDRVDAQIKDCEARDIDPSEYRPLLRRFRDLTNAIDGRRALAAMQETR